MVGRVLSRSGFVFLTGLLLLILLIQVLPQVDLPATAFRQNSEPLSMHGAMLSSPLVFISTSAAHRVFSSGKGDLFFLSSTVFFSATRWGQPDFRLRC